MTRIKHICRLPVLLVVLFYGTYLQAADKTIAEFTRGMEHREGFFSYYLDRDEGRIYLQVSRFNEEFIYQVGLSAGAGSNNLGLDRNQLGSTRAVRFERVGTRILMHQSNWDFRANSKNEAERRAVTDAFATSVIWGFKKVAGTGDNVLVDLTPFLLSDRHGVTRRLQRNSQGSFRPDADRSALYLPRVKNFPDNTEFEATLTFSGTNPGRFVRQVTPNPGMLTVRQHISFIRLPDNRYKPRPFHVNSGFYPLAHEDHAAAIEEPLKKRFICRHRLQKKNPGAALSEPVKPVIYYVDRAIPEPIRSAVIEGAGWWKEAFEAAGFKNGFQIKLLPEDADPMDMRYNMINWVHRTTRGWSYGSGIIDPRTGEIIKGHVVLGSLRIRQDFLIAQGLLAPFTGDNSGVNIARDMALARIRQLSAHEVGHTLGLSHNYASSYNDRASVMDYPHPLVRLSDDNRLDFSQAYARGIGEWDRVAIRCGYGETPAGIDDKTYMQSVIDEAFAKGLRYITDADSRGIGNLHAESHLWDNGKDSLKELSRLIELRRFALNKFSVHAIPKEEPLSSLEEVLVPLYFLHRYQAEAAGKMVGGMTYTYTLHREKTGTAYTLVEPQQQIAALDALLETVSAEFLALPENVLALLPPKAPGYSRSRESFPHHTGRSFDALALTEASAGHTMSILLHHQRAARMIEFHARDSKYPGFEMLLDRITGSTLKAGHQERLAGSIQRRVNHVFIHHLMLLAQNKSTSEAVKAAAMLHLSELATWLDSQIKRGSFNKEYKAHYYFEARRIAGFLRGDYKPEADELAKMPPGAPI
jgi:hypothetical protein